VCSRGYATHLDTEDSEGRNSDALETSQRRQPRKGVGSTGMKKRVELDAQGQPFGSMKSVLCSDIKKYAKDLDPTTGWEGQPRHERKRLFRRLYTCKRTTRFIPVYSRARLRPLCRWSCRDVSKPPSLGTCAQTRRHRPCHMHRHADIACNLCRDVVWVIIRDANASGI